MRSEIQEAVRLLREQHPNGVERALELLQGTVVSFGMKVCGHREDAEDTAQEVLLKVIPYLPRFNSAQALSVWLYKVARNQCLMGRRKSKFAPQRHLALDELMPEPDELARLAHGRQDSPETSLLRAEDFDRLREAVLCLPPEYRLILVLHDMEELSTAEVAKVTGLREGTVRVRLHRARLFVRKELSAPDRLGKGRERPRRRRAAHQIRRPAGRCKQLFAKLSDYLDNELDDSLCQELDKHLKGCAPCEAFLSSLEQTVEHCRKYQAPCSKPEEAANARRRLLERYEQALTAVETGASSPTRP